MTRRVFLAIALVFSSLAPIGAAHEQGFQTGTLVDIRKAGPPVDDKILLQLIFVVQVGDSIYEATTSENLSKSEEFADSVIVGDPIKVAIHGEEMTLANKSGNELTIKIIRRKHAE